MGYHLAMKNLVLGFLMVFGTVAAVRPDKITRAVPAIYVLGDSTLDVGTNNYLPGKDVPRANMPFYGIDFPGGPWPSTGRFSNGYNIADFVGTYMSIISYLFCEDYMLINMLTCASKTLGFKKSPPSYLSLKAHDHLTRSALHRGVNYASAGAGILDSTNAGKNIPLSEQVKMFASTKTEMVAKASDGVVQDLLARSFFLLGVGSNDLFQFVAAQQAQNMSATQKDAAALFSSLISNYSATITDLYKLGARKVGIINVGPVGCVPEVRVLNLTGDCNAGLNQLAVGFDGSLKSLLAALAPKLPGFAYSLADGFALSVVTLANPRAAGFVSADSACCGSGRLGGEGDCLPNATLCKNRDQFIFWDRVHSTQKAAELGARAFYDGPAQFTAPLNFKQLAGQKS